MNKTKIRFLTILALTLAFALTFGFAAGALFTKKSALAVDYRPSELFSAGTGGSVGASEAEENEDSFVEFTFSENDGSVHFRRDLALKWFAPLTSGTEEEGGEEGGDPAGQAETSDHETKYYSMTFAFPTYDFTRFTLTFEGAEENISKEGTSVNSLVFFYEENTLKVAVRNASEQPDEDVKEEEDTWFTETEKKPLSVQAGGEIVLSFTDEDVDYGEFAVLLNDEKVGTFTNIGGYFLEYLSSASSTPRDPITFQSDKLAEGKSEQKLLMKELNGQSFKLNGDGRVTDNADPVLIVNEEVYAYTLGRKWSLTYEAVDVCDSSVTVTRRYAMVNAANDDGTYPKPVADDYSSLTTSTVFMPTNDTQEEEQYVSIYFELDDGTNLSGLDSEAKAAKWVYLAWYAAADQTKSLPSAKLYECPKCGYQINKEDYDEKEDSWTCPDPDKKEGHGEVKKSEFEEKEAGEFTYILVNRGDVGADQTGEKSGPKYVGVEAKQDTLTNEVSEDAKTLAEKYQQAIDEIAYETVEEDGVATKKLKLSAGNGSYFYLPSLRELIASDNADYRNLRFSIYYKKQSLEVGGSASSATSLRYNALRFEIDEEGKYVFKILASDAAGNAMKYYVDGKLETVSASNIWDIEEIPQFEFRVGYTGATIEKPAKQNLGYRESTYTISSFDIVALDDYKATYKLYRFDGELPSDSNFYDDFVENAKEYFEKYVKDGSLTEIKKYNSDVSESDEDRWNRTDNKYHWNPDSSLSFVPQEATLYVVQLEVTEESRLPGKTATEYQIIQVQNSLDPIPNTTEWLESNITSVVLFSVSAVLLVIIVILFVVKPSDKNIEEVDVKTLRGKKEKKSKKDGE